MKVLVTGGAGFIGSHIVDAFCALGARVLVVDSLDAGVYRSVPPYLRKDVDYCFADLRQWTPDSRFEDVECVVHLAALGGVSRAARERANVVGANVLGTARLVDAASQWKKLKRVILASSFSIYGSNYTYRIPSTGKLLDGSRRAADLEAGRFEVTDAVTGEVAEILPIKETAIPSPLETYGASKYMQELCFRGFTHCPVTIFRFSSVYGTRLRLDDGEATIIAKLAGWIGSGVAPQLLEDGQQKRDWVYVGDIVEATMKVVSGVAAPDVLNVCSGVPTSLLQACDYLQTALGVTCPPKVVGGFRPGDMRHCLGDASSLTALLGRRPVSFQDGAGLMFAAAAEQKAGAR